MGKNKFSEVEKLLYDATNDKVKRFISQNKDQDILYVYAYNYNWDDGFDIPQTILDHENCDLSIALLIFYNADGLTYLYEKSENTNFPKWSSFIKKLYDSILSGKYQKGEIEYKVPLTKVQLYKLKKVLTEEENIFIENIEGKCLDINL